MNIHFKGEGTPKRLFRDSTGQDHMFEKSYEEEQERKRAERVECLGMTFENDEARRAYFSEKLREKLQDQDFRKIEGFPIGTAEDILALSDPPYYTACPNPFIEDFIRLYGRPYVPASDSYHREPFATDVSEGKNDPIYNAHSYHTKVPHKAIMRYILHYTEPGDVVFDGFCGTGMTGVAAQLCGDKGTVESLGYRVERDGSILEQVQEANGKAHWQAISKLGVRNAIQNDLSPAATFIAYNYNAPVDAEAFKREARRILDEVEAECGWMYETLHSDGRTKGRINYTVWSDVFVCPECTREVVFWEAAIDKKTGEVSDEFPCPGCRALLTKRRMDRAWASRFDTAINVTIRQTKQVPVLINYAVGTKRFEKKPDHADIKVIDSIEESEIPYWFPSQPMMFKGAEWGDSWRAGIHAGITHAHHFYTKRNLWVLAAALARAVPHNRRLVAWLTSVVTRTTKMYKYMPVLVNGQITDRRTGTVSGTLYLPSMSDENCPLDILKAKIRDFAAPLAAVGEANESTNSSTGLLGGNTSVDYIFTDPPFGGNLMYSELNFLWEAWLKVFTNNVPEAITNESQHKGLPEYQSLMTRCFREYYRVLKPGRWMTVEFHNSQNAVWNAIQEALQRAGFVVADVRTLDKQQGSFKQVTSAGAVKQDIIISAYKPNGGLEQRFGLEAGTEEGAWDFVRTHLRQLPVFVSKDGMVETVQERLDYLLFDRMVAFHVQRGVTVPISAPEFYLGLRQRFIERDRMFFLSEQAAEYDKKRMTASQVMQLQLFVTNEDSSIQWLRQQLSSKPQTFQDIFPQFMKEIAGWQKHEKPLELSDILEESFLRYDGLSDVPSQIHSYLSSNFKDLRNLPKDAPELRAKAKDRWYVPDPLKAADIEKVRERALLREFLGYTDTSVKRLKVFRVEAVRAGFKKAWQERDYATIISVAQKIPENVLQEDAKLLMWYDQALTRTEK